MAPSTRKSSTEDKIQGSFNETKGAIKEKIAELTNNPDLKAEGKADKKSGRIQQRLGKAKENVAKLKGQLRGTKKAS